MSSATTPIYLYRFKTRFGGGGLWASWQMSGCLSIFVYQTTKHGVTLDWSCLRHDERLILIIGRALAPALMGPMIVVVLGVFRQHGNRVAITQGSFLYVFDPGATGSSCSPTPASAVRAGLRDAHS